MSFFYQRRCKVTYKPNRINRATYYNSNVAASLVCLLIVAAGYLIDLLLFRRILFTIIFFVPTAIFYVVYGVTVSTKRLHDTGKSGWLLLLYFVPYVNLYLLYVVLLKKTEESPNKYGKPPAGIYIYGVSTKLLSRESKV